MEPRPTLADIARLSGVAKATASLALRNHPKISAATRARVQQVAAEIHYRPDPALSRIAAHRWQSRAHSSDATIAFVTTDHPVQRDELAPEMRRAAVAQGEGLGYRVERFRLEDFAGPEALARVLYHRGIRGVIFGQIFAVDLVRRFPWPQFACIGAHLGYFQPPVSVVVPDFLHTVVRAWREAVAAGYRRIGVALLSEFQAIDLLDKISAALYCQRQLQPAGPAIPVRHFPLDDQAAFRAWLRRHRPEIVIGFNDTVYWWLRHSGRRVPEDVGYISLMLERRSAGEAAISGMATDLALVGRIAIEQLDILLRANRLGAPASPVTLQVPAIWHAGGTMQRPVPA